MNYKSLNLFIQKQYQTNGNVKEQEFFVYLKYTLKLEIINFHEIYHNECEKFKKETIPKSKIMTITV